MKSQRIEKPVHTATAKETEQSLFQSSAPTQALDSETRAAFEPKFTHDFSKVRVYSSEQDQRLAHGLDAFTSQPESLFGTAHQQADSPFGSLEPASSPLGVITRAAIPTVAPRTTTTVQRRAASDHAPSVTDGLSERIQAAAGSGAPLEQNVQAQLETHLGADLSGVRVHTGLEADQLSHQLHANAFTTGDDIFFRQGLYNPASSDGMRLLAHEATHTVQQANGEVDGVSWGGGVKVSEPNDRFEQAAETTARNMRNASPVVASPNGSSDTGIVQRETSEEEKQSAQPNPEKNKEVRIQQSPSDAVLIQRDSTSNARPQKPSPSTDDRINQIEKDLANQKKRATAGEVDDIARSQIIRKLSESTQAIFRLTQAFQRGKTGFETTQAEQARSDAIRNQILMMVGTTAFAWAFEPAAGALGTLIDKSEEGIKKWQKGVEKLENVANAAVSGTSNILGQNAQNQTAIKGATPTPLPASGVSGDPLVFLSSNLETVNGFVGRIESLFALSKARYAEANSEYWDNYNRSTHESLYSPILADIAKLVKLETLKPVDELSKILEKHLWAAWIKSSSIPITKGYGPSKDKKLEDRKADEFDDVAMSLGSDVEVKLNELGISASAGVKLTGHFYSSNEPKNWHAMLYVWARDYAEKIS